MRKSKRSKPSQSFNQFVIFRYYSIFANFHKQFIKSFSKIAVLYILILKTITPLTWGYLIQFMSNKNELDTNVNNRVSSSKIDNKNENLSSNIKKISFKIGFFTIEARLVFI